MKKTLYAATALLIFAGFTASGQSSEMSKSEATARTSASSVDNVGIGTIDPKTKLHILGDGATSGIATSFITGIAITGSSAGGPGNGFPGSGIYFENVGLPIGSRLLKMNYTSNGTEPMLNFQTVSDDGTAVTGSQNILVLTRSGKMGIGVRTPEYKLDVFGDMNASGSVRAAGVALTSDARLKRNIKGVSYGLDAVMALRPVEYQKKSSIKSDDYNRYEIGFIAQEVEKIMPSLISVGADTDKMLAVSYTELIPVLTKAIQEQQVKIAALEKQNTDLKAEVSKISQLGEELNVLKASIETLAGEKSGTSVAK